MGVYNELEGNQLDSRVNITEPYGNSCASGVGMERLNAQDRQLDINNLETTLSRKHHSQLSAPRSSLR